MGSCGGAPATIHASTGDATLDRAVAICDAHRHLNGQIIDTYPPQQDYDYEKPYEAACSKVYDAWNKSTAAAELKARQVKDKTDLDFLNGYAEKLP